MPPTSKPQELNRQRNVLRISAIVFFIVAAVSFRFTFTELFTEETPSHTTTSVSATQEQKSSTKNPNPYSALNRPSIDISSPKEGSVLTRGKQYTIVWSLKNIPPSATIHINLVAGDYQLIPIRADIPGTNTSYAWTADTGGTSSDASTIYRIAVSARWEENVVVNTSGTFSIR